MKGMTLNQLRYSLRLDLKDSGALWSDAELNRSVERAVQDLSRHLPLEKVYEETLSFTVTSESFTTPAASSATAIVNAASLATTGNGDVLTIADHTPDVPRRLTVTLADASITKLTAVVKGYNENGYYIEESWYLKDLTTAIQGKLHFKRVVQVEVNNIEGNGTGDTLSVGTGNAYDSWIWLGYKPIKPKSETVTNAAGTTTYSRDTDYTMDYYNGAIRFINGGSMAAATAYLVSYTKSKLGMDISSILPVASRISRVEYPADQVPQQFANFSIYGDFLHIGSKLTGQSQQEMSTNHIAVYYEQPHSPPSEGSPGSYPAILDELVSIGAGGDALLTKAMELEHQAVTDLASLRAELGSTTNIHNLVATALGKINTYLANNTNEDAKTWLTKITTDATELRSKIVTALGAAATNLGLVFTASLDKAVTGAEAYLDTGDDNLTSVTNAPEADRYATYAAGRANIAAARVAATVQYIAEAQARLANLITYIQQAGGWSNIAEGFVSEAARRLEEINLHLQEANQWAETVQGDIVLSDRFRTEGQARLNEFESKLRNKAEYRKRTSTVSTKQPM